MEPVPHGRVSLRESISERPRTHFNDFHYENEIRYNTVVVDQHLIRIIENVISKFKKPQPVFQVLKNSLERANERFVNLLVDLGLDEPLSLQRAS